MKASDVGGDAFKGGHEGQTVGAVVAGADQDAGMRDKPEVEGA